jgi:small subunit ribosomal protein S9
VSDEERNEPQDEVESEGEVEPQGEVPEEELDAPSEPVDEPDEPVQEPAEDEPADEPDEDVEETEEEPVAASKDKEKKDQPVAPGADLEPIAIEGERELTAEERARLEAEAEERARLEAEATEDLEEEPAPRRKAEIPSDTRIQATGKRKSSIARVVVSAGEGAFEVNGKPLDDYFPREHHRVLARQPLVTSGFEESVQVRVRVHGGGVTGQAGAIRHGVARALTEIDSELRRDLKRRGMLTRDARRKERRKAGLKKARKRPQFSKR